VARARFSNGRSATASCFLLPTCRRNGRFCDSLHSPAEGRSAGVQNPSEINVAQPPLSEDCETVTPRDTCSAMPASPPPTSTPAPGRHPPARRLLPGCSPRPPAAPAPTVPSTSSSWTSYARATPSSESPRARHTVDAHAPGRGCDHPSGTGPERSGLLARRAPHQPWRDHDPLLAGPPTGRIEPHLPGGGLLANLLASGPSGGGWEAVCAGGRDRFRTCGLCRVKRVRPPRITLQCIALQHTRPGKRRCRVWGSGVG
jgi:hypothetical protein